MYNNLKMYDINSSTTQLEVHPDYPLCSKWIMWAFMPTCILYIPITLSSTNHSYISYASIWSYSIIGTPNDIT